VCTGPLRLGQGRPMSVVFSGLLYCRGWSSRPSSRHWLTSALRPPQIFCGTSLQLTCVPIRTHVLCTLPLRLIPLEGVSHASDLMAALAQDITSHRLA